MASPFQQLRAKLSELFQLEAAAELDFGIYRILRHPDLGVKEPGMRQRSWEND